MTLVVIAMKEEADLILQHPLPNVKVILTGVGKVNAASKLTEAITHNTIDKILNLGFAGASGEFHVGDIVVVNRAMYHDFDLSLFGYVKGQVPGYPPFFETDQNWGFDIHQYPMKTADLYTGDYFKTEHYATSCLYDMEGTALFQVAHRFNIPLLSIKVVSDLIGSEAHFESYRQFEASEGAKHLLSIYQKLLGGTL
jgi:adenosylhomocysteine nucleosidase